MPFRPRCLVSVLTLTLTLTLTQGTCRPTHYHVLRCPPSLTADEIQQVRVRANPDPDLHTDPDPNPSPNPNPNPNPKQFTFDLCHIYARCTKIASRPAPLYSARRTISLNPSPSPNPSPRATHRTLALALMLPRYYAHLAAAHCPWYDISLYLPISPYIPNPRTPTP